MGLFNFWPNKGKKPEPPEDITSAILASNIGPCPYCLSDMKDHELALIASSVLRGDNVATCQKFLDSFRQHRWEELSSFQSWEAISDDLEAYAVRCSDSIFIVMMMSPYNFMIPDQLVGLELVSSTDLPRFNALYSQKHWKAMRP